MSNSTNKLVVVIKHGIDDELSSIGFTIANGGLNNGMEVSIFLTSGGVDLVRKGGAEMTRVKPFLALRSLIASFQEGGGTIWSCTPCTEARGYKQENLLDGVIITGAGPMLQALKEGAASISF
jgi:predicted peroxiredoxin